MAFASSEQPDKCDASMCMKSQQVLLSYGYLSNDNSLKRLLERIQHAKEKDVQHNGDCAVAVRLVFASLSIGLLSGTVFIAPCRFVRQCLPLSSIFFRFCCQFCCQFFGLLFAYLWPFHADLLIYLEDCITAYR